MTERFPTDRIDPVTLSVIRARLETITDEMDVTMFRSALSPVIADSHDVSHGIYHRTNGGTVAQGVHGHPIFVGIMSHAVRALISHVAETELRPGDVFLTNDPYITGTHLQDMKVVAPVFVGGKVFCYVAGSGHWTDVGGPVPGNWNPTAPTFYHEGLRVPFTRIVAQGRVQDDVLNMILANIRLADWAESDLRSQLQVLSIGAKRIAELCEEYGSDIVQLGIDELIRRAAAMMRRNILAIPDGTYSFNDYLDNDGIIPTPLKLSLDLVVKDDLLTLDFSRTTGVSRGPFNISRPTFEAACFVAIKHVFADVPPNAGVMDAVRIVAPVGSYLNVEAPIAVGGYTEVSLRVIDTVFGALAQAMPDRLWGASFGTVCSLVIAGIPPARPFVAFLYFGGGLGGSEESDGLNHGPSALSNSFIASVELAESRFPIRFHQWALRPNSGGDGRHRGGLGAVYEIELLEESAESFFIGDRAVFPPYGVNGGAPGSPTKLEYHLSGKLFSPPLFSKADRVPMVKGDVVTLFTPGGGGYGDPGDRLGSERQRDELAGYVATRQVESTERR